jgi:hypothetical protein
MTIVASACEHAVATDVQTLSFRDQENQRQRAPAPPRPAQHRTGVRILEGGARDQRLVRGQQALPEDLVRQ